MRAAVYGRPGAERDLVVELLDRPEPARGEVRVRLTLAGVNPTDHKTRTGLTPQPIDEFQIAGHDGVGVIDAAGPGVKPDRIGERVWVHLAAFGRRWGTAAEWTVLPADRAARLPHGVPDEVGAGLGVPAITAHRCLFADGPLAGQTVLVAGGAGAVGHAAVQLARWGGARVIATVGDEARRHQVLEAGAHAVIGHRDPDAAERIAAAAPDGVDRVVEVALRQNLDTNLAVLARGATLAVYADDGQGPVGVPARALMARDAVLRFVLLYAMSDGARRTAVADIQAALAAGALQPRPVTRFGLEDAAAAQQLVAGGHPAKVLLDLSRS
jgi:NADPH2:quinone reductase